MTETEKLRDLVAEYERYQDDRDWRRGPGELQALITAQSVFALAEQIDRTHASSLASVDRVTVSITDDGQRLLDAVTAEISRSMGERVAKRRREGDL